MEARIWKRRGHSDDGEPFTLYVEFGCYFVALDPANGKTLWKYNPGGPETNAPMTYEWAGRQYVVLAAQNKLYAFALPVGVDTRGK